MVLGGGKSRDWQSTWRISIALRRVTSWQGAIRALLGLSSLFAHSTAPPIKMFVHSDRLSSIIHKLFRDSFGRRVSILKFFSVNSSKGQPVWAGPGQGAWQDNTCPLLFSLFVVRYSSKISNKNITRGAGGGEGKGKVFDIAVHHFSLWILFPVWPRSSLISSAQLR